LSQASFTGATAESRLAALFDPDCRTPLISASHLKMMRGNVAGRQILAVATDPQADKGALGIAECSDLHRAIRLAQETNAALVLLIDSAGARLYEGLPIQGALRRLMRELLDARLDGLPVLALLGRNVFGGASYVGASRQPTLLCVGHAAGHDRPARAATKRRRACHRDRRHRWQCPQPLRHQRPIRTTAG